MKSLRPVVFFCTVSMAMMFGARAGGEMFITEWMYAGDEFVEFTNSGSSAIDMTGWSYDDDSRTPGSVDLSAFGLIQPGQSVILCEAAANDFRSRWNLPSSVVIIGSCTHNLGRADEINLYDAFGNLVDRLTYNDQASLGPRTQGYSGNPLSLDVLGMNDATQWVLSAVGDRFGSYASTLGHVANPGIYVDAVPEPSMFVLLAIAITGVVFHRRWK